MTKRKCSAPAAVCVPGPIMITAPGNVKPLWQTPELVLGEDHAWGMLVFTQQMLLSFFTHISFSLSRLFILLTVSSRTRARIAHAQHSCRRAHNVSVGRTGVKVCPSLIMVPDSLPHLYPSVTIVTVMTCNHSTDRIYANAILKPEWGLVGWCSGHRSILVLTNRSVILNLEELKKMNKGWHT